MEDELIAVFGLITDIQYARCENGISYDKKRIRYYENSVNLVRNAVQAWKKEEKELNTRFKFIIQLGDIIDGKAKQNNESIESMNLVLNELKKLFSDDEINKQNLKLLHIWGNHEMYNFKRKELINLELNTAKILQPDYIDDANYYTYDVTDNLRLICLDLYQFSMLGYDKNENIYQECYNFLRQFNPNENLNCEEGLKEEHAKYLEFNGGLHKNQLKWLQHELQKCKDLQKKSIVCGHNPIHLGASNQLNLAYNCDEILSILKSFNGTVVAYFAGHFHPGNYFLDENDIHHITFQAIVETKPDSNSFTTVKVFKQHVLVTIKTDSLKEYKILL